MIRAIMSVGPIRRRILFALRQWHYKEMGVLIPVGQGLSCPIVKRDYWHSFEEIFFTDEYRPVFDTIPLPGRWLDIGCHAGFFSLFVVQQRRKAGLPGPGSALLIDGDARVIDSIREIQAQNPAAGKAFDFLHGAIAKSGDTVEFEEEVAMSSALAQPGQAGKTRRLVPVALPEQITARLAPPYDLVKIDVEGAEHDFLSRYQGVLEKSKHLLLEWHSWHFGGGGLPAIQDAAAKAGFREVKVIVPAHPTPPGSDRSCGVILYENGLGPA